MNNQIIPFMHLGASASQKNIGTQSANDLIACLKMLFIEQPLASPGLLKNGEYDGSDQGQLNMISVVNLTQIQNC